MRSQDEPRKRAEQESDTPEVNSEETVERSHITQEELDQFPGRVRAFRDGKIIGSADRVDELAAKLREEHGLEEGDFTFF